MRRTKNCTMSEVRCTMYDVCMWSRSTYAVQHSFQASQRLHSIILRSIPIQCTRRVLLLILLTATTTTTTTPFAVRRMINIIAKLSEAPDPLGGYAPSQAERTVSPARIKSTSSLLATLLVNVDTKDAGSTKWIRLPARRRGSVGPCAGGWRYRVIGVPWNHPP